MELDDLIARLGDSPLSPLQPLLTPARLDSLRHGDFQRWRGCVRDLPGLLAETRDFTDAVVIGAADEITPPQRQALEQGLRGFLPWRKGPFDVFGIHIDTEWRSDLKWQRLAQAIEPLQGRTVLDVGAGNGYYCLRMLGQGAELVIGIDPHLPFVAQAWALKRFIPRAPAWIVPCGLEDLPLPLPHFDTVFSMGVLYHRRSPVDHLLELLDCLRPGGELVLETLYVEGDEGYCLTPANTYARMNKIWFIPSIATLQRWLARCGYERIEVIDESVTTIEEQRATDWMPFDSLVDSLQTDNPELTIEGLPAPRRVIISAHAPG